MWRPLLGYGVALADFQARGEQQINLQFGQVVKVLGEYQSEWYYGKVVGAASDGDAAAVGIFPVSYVALQYSNDDPITLEIREVLGEWTQLLVLYYRDRRIAEFTHMRATVDMLLNCLRKIRLTKAQTAVTAFNSTNRVSTSEDQLSVFKFTALAKIEDGRRLLGLDLVVRTANGEAANETNTPIITLYELHQRASLSKTNEHIRRVPRGQSRGESNNVASANSPLTPATTDAAPKPPSKHLVINMKGFICALGDEAELLFSIYHNSKSTVVSEQFQVLLTARGAPIDTDRVGDMRNVFIDLPPLAPLTDLWLTCKVIRRGAMIQGKKDDHNDLRRPIGLAVLNLGEAGLRRGKEIEHMIPIYQHAKDEAQFSTLFDLIVGQGLKDVMLVPRSTGISVSLTMFTGAWPDVLAQEPSLAKIPITHSLGFFDEDNSTQVPRNDLIVAFKEADFGTSSNPSVEVITQLRAPSSGLIIPNSFIAGTSYSMKACDSFRTLVLHKNATPRWDECVTVRLPLANQIQPGTHLFFNFRDVNKDRAKCDGFAYATLDLTNATTGAVIADAVHQLSFIKPSKGVDPRKDPAWYLRPNGIKERKKNADQQHDWFKVQMKLVSNQITQNPYLHGLFNWRKLTPPKLVEVLGKIAFAGDEIVRFTTETFVALFAIMDARITNTAQIVFSALTSVIEILVDEKKQRRNFRPIIDHYLSEQFNGIYAQESLLLSLTRYFGEYKTKKSSELIATLKALEYLIKFTIQSRVLLMKNGDQVGTYDLSQFKAQLTLLFNQIGLLLKDPLPQLVGAQTICLKKLGPVFDLLPKIFFPSEFAQIIIETVQSIRSIESGKSLNLEKLALIRTVLVCEVFASPEARNCLLPPLIQQILLHLRQPTPEELQILLIIVHILLDANQKAAEEPFTAELVLLLPELVKLLIADHSSPQAPNYCVSVLSLYFMMDTQDFAQHMATLAEADARNQFLKPTCDVISIMLTTQIFPENWFVVHMFMYSTVMKVIVVLAHFMQQRLELLTSEWDLWSSFFGLVLAFVTSPVLDLESFAESKRKLVLDQYNDMRVDVVTVLQAIWQLITPEQHGLFIDSLVPAFFQLMILQHQTLSEMGFHLFASVLEPALVAGGARTKQIEVLTLRMLDVLYATLYNRAQAFGYVGEDSQREFVGLWFANGILPAIHARLNDSPSIHQVYDAAQSFVSAMTQFMELVFNLRVLPSDDAMGGGSGSGDSSNSAADGGNNVNNDSTARVWEDERTLAIIELMAYLKASNRIGAYSKYVQTLVEEHIKNKNFIEAGNAVVLLASGLSFDAPVNSFEESVLGHYPRQTTRDRKVALLRKAIECFSEGKLWESAIKICGELIVYFEYGLHDHNAVQELVAMQQHFTTNIASVERYWCEYFRVGFYGLRFPTALRNREFIYRGFELERLSDFSQRIQSKYQGSQLLTYTDPPSEEVMQSDGQFLQIFTVRPCALEEKDGLPNPRIEDRMHASVQKYFYYNEVNCFVYNKPLRKNKQKAETQAQEVADLWLRSFYYVTEDTFPSVRRRSPITAKYETETNPINNAISSTKDKIREIAQLTAKHEHGQGALTSFTMVLNGVIDASVNVGTKAYKEAFLCDAFLAANPDKVDASAKLFDTLLELTEQLKTSLAVHARLRPADMAGLHERLEEQLKIAVDAIEAQRQIVPAMFARYRGCTLAEAEKQYQLYQLSLEKSPRSPRSPREYAPQQSGEAQFTGASVPASMPSPQLSRVIGASRPSFSSRTPPPSLEAMASSYANNDRSDTGGGSPRANIVPRLSQPVKPLAAGSSPGKQHSPTSVKIVTHKNVSSNDAATGSPVHSRVASTLAARSSSTPVPIPSASTKTAFVPGVLSSSPATKLQNPPLLSSPRASISFGTPPVLMSNTPPPTYSPPKSPGDDKTLDAGSLPTTSNVLFSSGSFKVPFVAAGKTPAPLPGINKVLPPPPPPLA